MIKNFEDIKKISSNNKSLKFIYNRFTNDNYRGIHLFQHNRYDSKKMYDILEILKKYASHWIDIPKGDLCTGKNKGFLLGDYKEYEKIIVEMKKNKLKGTGNTLKKNYFPDFENFEVIERKNNQMKLRDEISKNTREDWEKQDLFKKSINKAIHNKINIKFKINFIDDLYWILTQIPNNKIYFYEFLLFVSYIVNENINKQEIVDLILSWRELRKLNEQKTAIAYLKDYMNPNNYKNKPKNKKRDWGNFKNETQEIFDKLCNSKIFQITKLVNRDESYISLNFISEKNSLSYKIKRNIEIYEEYHKINGTKKTPGFQMDHIIKFSLLTEKEDIPYIENHLNLIYIDGKNHAIKTYYNSNHMILNQEKNLIKLSDINNIHQDIELILDKDVLFKIENIEKYIKHNKETIKYLNKN